MKPAQLHSVLDFKFLAGCLWILFFFVDKSFQESSKAHKLWFHPTVTKEIQSCLSEDLEQEEQETCRFYAAVIDAGSTGTRLHLFEFSHDIGRDQSPFKLEQETFKEVKPGLSSFAQTPELAAKSIRELLVTAKQVVPANLWPHTPITLKATAGLRLLPENRADAILSQVALEVARSGLLMEGNENSESVGMLSGIDEGVFGWFTLNYLLGRLDNVFSSELATAAALDLGGGSTQVTFFPKDLNAALKGFSPEAYSHQLNLFNKEVKLYTHSYLGNGLLAARIGIAKLSAQSNEEKHVLFTSCFPHNFRINNWDYAGEVWLVSSTTDASFEACLASTRQYVQKVSKVVPISELADNDVFVFSYFYDRGLQAGLIKENAEQSGGFAKVVDYKVAAKKACSIPADEMGREHWKPWQCLDLTYIYTLLYYGYGLPDEKYVHLSKKLKQKEVSWALGAGFYLLNSYHNRRVRKKQANSNSKKIFENKKSLNITSIRSSGFIEQLVHYISDAATHVLVYLNLTS